MQSELNHVEGDWAALRWAIGGASVLARHAFLRAVTLGGTSQSYPLAGASLSKEGRFMRKTTLAAVGVCAAAMFLLFLAPAFRQAFRVSLTQWDAFFNPLRMGRELDFKALARRAEQQHDPDGLAFVAIHDFGQSGSARLADEAVNLDPNLTWVYAAVAVNHPQLPEIDQWVPQLKQWDPQNALPYLITAESLDNEEVRHAGISQEKVPSRVDEQSPAWRDAFANAFQSAKLDTYLDRLTALDRRVLVRYSLDDPYDAVRGENWGGLPSYAAGDASRYADWRLKSAEALEAQGDHQDAVETYSEVARFGSMLAFPGGFPLSHSLQDAYRRLAALCQQAGNMEQAGLYLALASNVDRQREEERASMRERWASGTVSQWNASVVKVSGLMIVFIGVFALACVVGIVVRSRSLRIGSLRAGRVACTILAGSFTGIALSSAMLYVSYHPYAEILRRYVRDGDSSRIDQLRVFLYYTQMPLGANYFNDVSNFTFHVWICVVALCALALLVATLIYLKLRPRASAVA